MYFTLSQRRGAGKERNFRKMQRQGWAGSRVHTEEKNYGPTKMGRRKWECEMALAVWRTGNYTAIVENELQFGGHWSGETVTNYCPDTELRGMPPHIFQCTRNGPAKWYRAGLTAFVFSVHAAILCGEFSFCGTNNEIIS